MRWPLRNRRSAGVIFQDLLRANKFLNNTELHSLASFKLDRPWPMAAQRHSKTQKCLGAKFDVYWGGHQVRMGSRRPVRVKSWPARALLMRIRILVFCMQQPKKCHAEVVTMSSLSMQDFKMTPRFNFNLPEVRKFPVGPCSLFIKQLFLIVLHVCMLQETLPAKETMDWSLPLGEPRYQAAIPFITVFCLTW